MAAEPLHRFSVLNLTPVFSDRFKKEVMLAGSNGSLDITPAFPHLHL